MTLTHEQRQRQSAARAELRAVRKEAKANAPAKVKQARAFPIAEGQRQPRERDPGFLAFLRRLPCVAGLVEGGGCSGAVQAAHTRFSDAKHGRRNSGMQAKPSDRHATSLCAGHHLHDQHAGSEVAFWARLGIDPGDLSAALHRAYQAGEDGAAVLRRFIPSKEPAE